jgi:methylmalonyl-CoA mutase C-terminal domain/subunit
MAKSDTATKVRVLIGKPGLDGHDQGAKVVVRALMDAGCEVIYTGLRQSVEAIVKTALEEDVDVIGLSIMSGAHLPICEKMKTQLDAQGLGRKLWIVGGNIPAADRQALIDIGVDAVFPTGTKFGDLTRYVLDNAPGKS